MIKHPDEKDTVRMSVTASKRFQKICNMLAGMKGVSRDRLIEIAVTTAFSEEIAANQQFLSDEDESELVARTAVA